MVMIYERIDEKSLAKDYAAILAYNFPNSKWYEKSYNLLNDIGISQNNTNWFEKFNPIKLFINDSEEETYDIQKID